jgi:hypothetical protein
MSVAIRPQGLRMPARVCFALFALGLLSAPAASQTIEGIYTSFDAKTCRHQKGKDVEDYGSWACPGYAKLRVRLSAGDQRMFVTFGPGKDALAMSQTFPGFNDVYQGTVEWRIDKSAGKAKPFATILRWNVVTPTDRDKATGPIQPSGRVLVVTRLGPGGVCHVGYVDAKANPDANALARKIADENARAFKCGKDKRIVRGKVGDIDMPDD